MVQKNWGSKLLFTYALGKYNSISRNSEFW